MTEDQQRFEEIIQQIGELTEEARNLLPESVLDRANSYWYAHITTALNDNNEFMGRSMCNMQDTLEDWKELTDESSYPQFNTQEEYDDYIARFPLPNDDNEDEVEETNFIDGYESPGWVRKLKGCPLPNEGPINDEDWD